MGAHASTLERLGLEPDTRAFIIHADDNGLCEESTAAIARCFESGTIRSTSIMVPCPGYASAVAWARAHPDADIGVHVTLTSEWPNARWGPVSEAADVASLVDADGYLWPTCEDVARHAKAEDVQREIRAQIQRALDDGIQLSHIDTHMGAVFVRPDLARAYLETATSFSLAAATVDPTPTNVPYYIEAGYPIHGPMIEVLNAYDGPRLTFYTGVSHEPEYEDFIAATASTFARMPPGLHQIYVHPTEASDRIKGMLESWQQREHEAKVFGDERIRTALRDAGVVVLTWREVMERFATAPTK